jgi:hypothetical protein
VQSQRNLEGSLFRRQARGKRDHCVGIEPAHESWPFCARPWRRRMAVSSRTPHPVIT